MGKIVVKSSRDDRYYYVLKARNGEIVATSVMYKDKEACMDAVSMAQSCAERARVEDQTQRRGFVMSLPKFELTSPGVKNFRFVLKGPDGNVLLSSESYTTKANCQNGISSVKDNAPEAVIMFED